MRSNYPFEDLFDLQFEELINRICTVQLGFGVISFSPGRDGGRDGRFTGTASQFPSPSDPLTGKFIIQSKWTGNPIASCGDSAFATIIDKEIPRIIRLIDDDEVNHYLLFTNRKKPAGSVTKLQKKLDKLKLGSSYILGREELIRWLDFDPSIWKSMNFPSSDPFRFNSDEIIEVVTELHSAISGVGTPFDSASNFSHLKIKKKNKKNKLSERYDEYIRESSLPHFGKIRDFLSNPRNSNLKDLYHDAADELKQKITTHRASFEGFEDVLTYLSDQVLSSTAILRGRKRLVRVLLHYMYYDCDIGQHA